MRYAAGGVGPERRRRRLDRALFRARGKGLLRRQVHIDLAPAALERLRANNVLYDRQGTGEYFQAYTKDFDGGFFFEIVQRRGYAGFGAANAPIRLAAQTRLARHPAIPRR